MDAQIASFSGVSTVATKQAVTMTGTNANYAQAPTKEKTLCYFCIRTPWYPQGMTTLPL